MFERFTKSARAVVTRAEQHAVDTSADEIRPEHLMMALLDQDECLAVAVLGRLDAPAAGLADELNRRRRLYVDGLDEDDAEALRMIGIDLDEVVRRIDHNLGGLRPTGRTRPRFSRASKKVLQLALREALALRHNYIGTEHLLLGLARADDRVVADTLAAFGIEHGTLRNAVREAVRRAG